MVKPITIRRQQGAVLLVSLVVLTVITLGALVAMQRSSIQIRMVSNLQHQHELDNAALSTLNSVYTQILKNGVLQNKLIIEAENRFKLAEDDPDESPAQNTFSQALGLTQPSFSANSVGTISSQVEKLPSPESSGFYLKGTKGCGSSCSVIYVAIDANVKGKNDIAEVNQEIGVKRLVPST